MQWIVMHQYERRNGSGGLLPLILADDPLARMVYEEYTRPCGSLVRRKTLAVPREWRVQNPHDGLRLARYTAAGLGPIRPRQTSAARRWCIISNGRYVTHFAGEQLQCVLQNRDGVIALRIDPSLKAYRESVCLGSGGLLAGFKRVYAHSISPGFLDGDWPHHVCIRLSCVDRLLIDGKLPLDFGDFLRLCDRQSLACTCFHVGGTVLDLETEAGILQLFAARRRLLPNASARTPSARVSPTARLFGRVLMADDVCIGDGAVVVGPAVLGRRCNIGPRAVVKGSIVAADVSVPAGAVVCHRILNAPDADEFRMPDRRPPAQIASYGAAPESGYRVWPLWSYARFTKRILDIAFSLAVLCLFAPFFPIVALMVKLNSPGPIFFKHKRQGLHARPFNCLKFRTMILRADSMQAQLRSRNRVDGPQFKIEDDPRVTTVGRFLRNTFIDEIPQFFNVLLGQMSVVGPRPSPEAENMLCPFWRDARLSVRPGVTGLWQVRRTRRFGQDFQEWIHYDTQYVRNMSWRQDVIICLQTVRKLVGNFFHQVQR